MLLIYRCFINILFPVIVIIIFVRKFINKEHKIRFKEKLFLSSLNGKKKSKILIWFHASSIGELKSIIPLIKKINEKNNFEFLITTVTLSSSQLMSENFLNTYNITHRFFPIDRPKLINKFLDNWSPNLAIFVDSEIWPNFLLEIKKRKIPLVLLNGRITKRTFLKWNFIKKSAEKIFKTFDLCLPSSNESKKNLEKLNVKNIKYFGNLKFTSENEGKFFNEKSNKFLYKSKFWCAASTHKQEDIFCLKTHINIKKIYKNIISIIIPRHTDRAQYIHSLCKKLELKSQVLSSNEQIDQSKEIIIINSYGVMTKYLRLCKSVFIGKSLIKELETDGGQNPIEAAKIGCKIYHGPYVYNFQEVYELLNKYQIAEKINNEDELSYKLIGDLNNTDEIRLENTKKINLLGKRILNETYNEIIDLLNNESS